MLLMAFRDEAEAARARADALERRLVEAERENSRLRGLLAAREAGDRPTLHPSRFRRPGTWFLIAAALAGLAGLIELDGGRPPWDELYPVIGVLTVASIAASILMLRAVARPGEILVVFGRPSGVACWRVVKQGASAFRMPFLERFERIDLRAIPIEAVLSDAPTRGARAALRSTAVVRIDPRSGVVDRAITMFIGRPRAEIAFAARTVIGAAAGAALARNRSEEAQNSPDVLADAIRREVEPNLEKLGLALVSLSAGWVESASGASSPASAL